jgi:hypothetical protein
MNLQKKLLQCYKRCKVLKLKLLGCNIGFFELLQCYKRQNDEM